MKDIEMKIEELHAFGFGVIPVNGTTKAPAMIDGHYVGVTSATRDLTKIVEWLTSGFGIAAVGGKVEAEEDKFLVMIDVDMKKENGEHTLRNLEAEYGDLPHTLNVISPSGGRHLYFYSEKKIGSTNDAFRAKFGQPSGIDVKGHHGYCVCPPTMGYKVHGVDKIAYLPKDWELFLTSLVSMRERTVGATFSIPPHAEVVTKFNEANPLHEMLKHFKYEQVGANTFRHPFGSTSRSNVVVLRNESFLRHGASHVAWHYGSHDKIQEGPHDSFDLYRLLRHGGNWDDAVSTVKYKAMLEQETSPSARILYRGGMVPMRSRQELISKHLTVDDVVMVSGESESYKTFWIMDMAFSMATGIPFLGCYPVRPCSSLLVLTESRGDYNDRLEAWIKVRSEEFKQPEEELKESISRNVFVYFHPLQIANNRVLEDFVKLAKDLYNTSFKPKVWFFDHFSANWGGADENNNAEVAKYLDAVRRFTSFNHYTTVLIHHPTKAGTQLRGASCLKNNCPVVYNFNVDKDKKRTVMQDKCSYYNGFRPYALDITLTDLRLNEDLVLPAMRRGLTLSADHNIIVPITEKAKGGRPAKYNKEELLEMIADKEIDLQDASRIFQVTERTAKTYINVLCDEDLLTEGNKSSPHNPTWKRNLDIG